MQVSLESQLCPTSGDSRLALCCGKQQQRARLLWHGRWLATRPMIALRLALFAGRPAAAEVTKQPDFSEQNCCPHNQVHKSKLLARTDPITRWRRPDPTGRSSSSGRRSYRGPGRPACRRRQCSRPTTIWSSFTSRRAGEFFFVVCKRECGGNDGVHDSLDDRWGLPISECTETTICQHGYIDTESHEHRRAAATPLYDQL